MSGSTSLSRRLAERLEGHFLGRVGLTLALTGATLVVYQHLNATVTPRFDLAVPLDALLPFWPWTWVVYVSFYALLPLAAWWVRPGEYLRTMAAVLTANVVCWGFFVLTPAHYPRPPLDGISPAWLHAGLAMMWRDDLPGNTFPSIHVATSMLVGLRLRSSGRGGGWWLLWCALIALSTLTVKQHFVVDVVAGLLLALAVNAVFFPPRVEAGTRVAEVPPPPGALNVSLALGIAALMLGAQWLAAQQGAGPLFWLAAAGYAFLLLPAYALLHDAEHGVFHAKPAINEGFGVLLGWLFPGPFTFLRMCHLGHHARNRSEVERFEVLEPGDVPWRRRAYFYFLYLGGFWLVVPVITVLIALWPRVLQSELVRREASSTAMLDGVPRAHRRRIWLEALGAVLWQGLGLWHFGWTWAALLGFAGLCWSAQQYVTHAFSPRDVLDGAHNLKAARLYEAWLLNFNWHLAHHQNPKVPWLYLPRFDDATRVRPGYAVSFLRFWAGPRRVNEPARTPAADGVATPPSTER